MEQVFGSGRERAAILAISELERLRQAKESDVWGHDTELAKQYLDALRVRNFYSEYGDTFRGH